MPIPIAGDLRAWDAVIDLEPEQAAVEVEARLRDIQALDCRCNLKLRDSGLECLVLLVNDTSHNRRLLREHRDALRASFPLDSREIMRALREGRTPGANGILVL